MLNYNHYNISEVLRNNIDLKRLAVLEYFYNKDIDHTKIEILNKSYIIFQPRDILLKSAGDINCKPDNILRIIKLLEKEEYLYLITGKWFDKNSNFCKSGVKLSKKFYKLLKE